MAGTAQDAAVQVMDQLSVVMVRATVMKTVKAALQIVANAATVQMAT